MENFSPITSTLGGMLLGLSSAWMLLANGRIAGVSGIVGRIATAEKSDQLWRILFFVGLIAGGALAMTFIPTHFEPSIRSKGVLIAAGLAVGFGTRLGDGCTSGHGICGLGRVSSRSFVSVLTFVMFALIGATVFRLLFAGAA